MKVSISLHTHLKVEQTTNATVSTAVTPDKSQFPELVTGQR